MVKNTVNNMEMVENKIGDIVEFNKKNTGKKVNTAPVTRKLEDITPDSKYVELCIVEGYVIRAQLIGNKGNHSAGKIKVYVRKLNGAPITSGIDKFEISRKAFEKNGDIIRKIEDFDLDVKKDDVKLSRERLEEFIRTSKMRTDVTGERSVWENYREMVKVAVDRAMKEQSTDRKTCRFIYDEDKATIAIDKDYANEFLEEIESDYKIKVLCRELKIVEADIKREIVVRSKIDENGNRYGNQYYAGDAYNGRYFYKFHIYGEEVFEEAA